MAQSTQRHSGNVERTYTGQRNVVSYLPGKRSSVYLTSFIHREELFHITERWLSSRLEPNDALRLTQILICDGFALGETLDRITRLLLSEAYDASCHIRRIQFKGELRESIVGSVIGLQIVPCQYDGIPTVVVEFDIFESGIRTFRIIQDLVEYHALAGRLRR